eukprot:6482341-Pyramimonas_sp.AAC.1
MLARASDASVACAKCVEAAAAQRGAEAREVVKVCVVCEVAQRRACFSNRMWAGVADQAFRRCRVLQRGCWKCIACKGVFHR